jgi:hypothetical protein
VDEQEYREILQSLDRALTLFSEKPTEPGFDLHLYEEIRRARETLIRSQRDWRARMASRPASE